VGNKIVMTPYQQEMLKALTKVKEYKKPIEANIIGCMFKNSELYYDCELTLDHFSHNEWKVYFAIIKNLVEVEKKEVLDEITVGLFLEKHDKLRAKYEEYGEYITIDNLTKYIVIENFNGYLEELKKWNVVIDLIKKKFPVFDMISDFADMKAEDIYNYYEAQLNHMFVNVAGNVKVYSLTHDLYKTIDELDKGLAVGLSYHGIPSLNVNTGGMALGNITLLGGLSNVGKSTIMRNTIIPSILEAREKLCILVNEDSLVKTQREMLVWTANNIFKTELQKYIIRDGKYSESVKAVLKKSADWLVEQNKSQNILIIPFDKYSTKQAIKIIKKYSHSTKFFCLDTFKIDSGDVSDKSWLQLQQNMTSLNDVIKGEAKNLHLLATFQLNKASAKQRCYTQDNIGGGGKNIIDPVSTCIMAREVLTDEYEGERKAIKVWRLAGKNSNIPVTLDKNKKYLILFIVKSREGSKDYQIVVESDLGRNVMREVGFTCIENDF